MEQSLTSSDLLGCRLTYPRGSSLVSASDNGDVADIQRIIETALDELHLCIIDSDKLGEVVAVSRNGVLTYVRPTGRPRPFEGERGVLVSVETGVKITHLRKPSVVRMLQSAGALLADCGTAIGGDAHGRILLHRVIASAELSVDSLVAVIASTQHLRRLLETPSERSGLPT
jgi:hypothetical protein